MAAVHDGGRYLKLGTFERCSHLFCITAESRSIVAT